MKLFEPNHADRGHHKFGPSGTGYRDPRVGGCLAFVNRKGTSTAAEEGTANHELLDSAIREWVNAGCTGSIADFLPTGMTDMEQSNMSFIINSIEGQIISSDEVHPELLVVLKNNDGEEINYGYLDLLTIQGNEAFITDYKFGWIQVPNAKINRQGWNYAAAVFQMFPKLQYITVQFAQPKIGYFTTYTFTRAEDADRLRFEIENIINQAGEAQQSQDAEKMNPGSACDYCQEAGRCPGYLKLFDLGKAKSNFPDAVEWSAESIETPEQAAAAMSWLSIFEATAGHIKNRCIEIAQEHGSIDCGDYTFKPASRSGLSKITSTEKLFDLFEESYNFSRHQLVPFMTISKSNAVKALTQFLSQENPEKTKKQIQDEIDSNLRVSGVIETGDPTTYLRKTKTKN